MRGLRRKTCPPSSSHKLAEMADETLPRADRIKRHLTKMEAINQSVSRLAGTAGAAWAIEQLTTAPFVVVGWPNPCKAARIQIRKAATR